MRGKLEIYTLGGLTIAYDEQPATELTSHKAKALLVYLTCTQRSYSRQVLAEFFWPDRPQTQSLANLRRELLALRQQFDACINITREAVEIDSSATCWLDVAEFERNVGHLDQSSASPGTLARDTVARFETALALYRGDFLEGFYVDSPAFEDWARPERERLRFRAMGILDSLVTHALSEHDCSTGLAYATRLLQMDSLREKTHGQLMLLLAQSGQRQAALAQYETCRRLLADELGVEPTAETTALYEQIRSGTAMSDSSKARHLKGYELRECIGTGGFGEVYRAYQPAVGREVAIKVILPQYANEPDFIRRFEAEAQLIARLEHPFIVPLYDYWRESGRAYLVMRWLRESLRDRLRRGPLALDEAAKLVEQIASALAAAHRQHVIHRDLKPANILLDDEGNAYLADFGIAQGPLVSLEAIQAGRVVSSPAYLSPEQIRSEPVTPGADIYSFGVMLYEMLTGQHPYPSHLTPTALLYKHLSEPIPSLRTVRPDLPATLDDVIQCATAKDFTQRYPDTLSLAAAFRRAVTQGQQATPNEPAIRVTPGVTPDAADFFERQAQTEQLSARLAEEGAYIRLPAVVGPSGSGKSGVVHSLPRQTTSFIGRHQEIAGIIALLDNPGCQLLTLWGPGGIGKTRLAIEIAKQISPTFADGVHYVALQPLHSVDQALHAIINLIGLVVRSTDSAQQQLLWYLGDKRLLLLLDNFEHLPDGAGLVSDILTAAPFVKVLVTSRETLNLREEWLWEVRGLSYPQLDGAVSPETYSAVQLFVERARQVRPSFTLADAGAAVIRICQLVEGMPLALELAANWTKTLSCEAIADEIQRNIDFLSSRASNIAERHRSTRAVFNHSWRLLSGEERSAFPRLTVFRGGFTREAAEQVGGVALATLASLVDKSLVRQADRGRYDIHELLRQYGDEQRAATDAVEMLKNSHASYYADLIARCEPDLKGDQQLSALNTIEMDFDNARAAWTHAVAQRDYNLVDRMIDGLLLYCELRGRIVEGQALFERVRAALAPVPGEAPQPVWGRVLVRAPMKDIRLIEEALTIARAHARETEVAFCLLLRGRQQCQQRRFAHAHHDLQDSLSICERLNDRYRMAQAIAQLTYFSLTVGDWAALKTYIDQGARLADEIGSPTWKYQFLFYAGWAACYDGRYEQSEDPLRQAEAIANGMGFRRLMADARGSLGFLAFLRGDLQQARTYLADDLEVVTRIKAQGEQGFATIVLAHIACVEGNYSLAQQLAEEALALVKPHPLRERFIARVLAMVACGLGDYDQARQQIHTVFVQETRPGIRLLTLPMYALLQAHEGNLERAAELLGLSFTHPVSAKGWLEHWPLITRLRQQLETQLGAEALTTAWENGSHLDLDTIVEQALVETEA